MSIGPSGMVGSFAGSPLSQSKGSDTDQVQNASTNQSREIQMEKNAEKASGIGETERHEEASERDADGRRLWEKNQKKQSPSEQDAAQASTQEAPRSRDATGQHGKQLDLSG